MPRERATLPPGITPVDAKNEQGPDLRGSGPCAFGVRLAQPSACGSRRADHFFLYFTLQPYGLVVAGDTALPSFSALTAFTT